MESENKYLTHIIYIYNDGTINVKKEEKPIRLIERDYE
jgi:hypothetical protein